MSHYLVTGGLGVVGSLFARHVAAQGHRVTVVDDGKDPRHDWTARQLGSLGIDVCRRDLRDDFWLGTVERIDFILHAAASTGIPYSATHSDDDWSRNVDTTRQLLDQLAHYDDPPRTVVLSSVKPCSTRVLPLTEDSPIDPDEPYAASKAAQAALCQAWGRTYDLPIWVLRCSNLYGPAPCHGPRHGWLTWFCIQAALGWPITIEGTGEQSRDMLYIDDLIAAIECLFHAEEPPPNGELFMMGGGGAHNQLSVNEAAEHMACAALHGPGRQHEDQQVYVTTEKFRSRFPDWNARVHPWMGMDKIVAWARANADELREVYKEFAP